MTTRVLNRKVPPPLPARRMLSRETGAIPTTSDHRPWDSPVKDQKNEGCCTGETGTSTLEWIVRRYFPQLGPLIFSPQYCYVKELQAQGDFPSDTGSDGVTLCNTMIVSGCCEESIFPFAAGQIAKPTAEQESNAASHRYLGAYHGLVGSKTALSVMGDSVPWPVMIGFSVYESFMSDQIERTGVMSIPEPGEELQGGHEVKLSGYDISAVPVDRPKNCPPAVRVKNSWSKDWGLDGYFWMPLPILDAPDTDMKIIHSGGPWKPK